MKNLPQISEAEYKVMKIIWSHSPISTNEVIEKLIRTTDWSPKTIQTMLKRLVQKGALIYEKEGRVFIYTPLVKEGEYLKHENIHFLERLYDGNIASMLTNFLANEKLSDKEIEELRNLLDSKEGGD
ncbi:BlaI family penicillinase repressor [Mobilisporobacter senegalensis]|uniref:BlaI family penicillinase repressor n=1 Tax=Mobilisporobacter senegalensis TaxID=1329262 RepID=A0A3N1XCS2_9FIRM|nr:BlaI/MecI/CopY family transcriptional regulator [Mobilisporobacter senegalensis]ROR23921.1 BlaI family penicillinase repressor [Mobilisporobacter senegalensis]